MVLTILATVSSNETLTHTLRMIVRNSANLRSLLTNLFLKITLTQLEAALPVSPGSPPYQAMSPSPQGVPDFSLKANALKPEAPEQTTTNLLSPFWIVVNTLVFILGAGSLTLPFVAEIVDVST